MLIINIWQVLPHSLLKGSVMFIKNILRSKRVLFWDFDGVIKDSVAVKTSAFEYVFSPYGSLITAKVRQHHEANGGVSRFEKIPLYLKWAGEPASPEQVHALCEQFSRTVVKEVIDSSWVPGVREYLLKYYKDQYFVLVTATPRDEIAKILTTIGISHCFYKIFGAPYQKELALKEVIDLLKCSPENLLMIGDSKSDLLAAQANAVPFLLRRTRLNIELQAAIQCPMFDDLSDG